MATLSSTRRPRVKMCKCEIFRRRWNQNTIHFTIFLIFFSNTFQIGLVRGYVIFACLKRGLRLGRNSSAGRISSWGPSHLNNQLLILLRNGDREKNTITPNKRKNRHGYLKQENSRTYFFDMLFFSVEFFFNLPVNGNAEKGTLKVL